MQVFVETIHFKIHWYNDQFMQLSILWRWVIISYLLINDEQLSQIYSLTACDACLSPGRGEIVTEKRWKCSSSDPIHYKL